LKNPDKHGTHTLLVFKVSPDYERAVLDFASEDVCGRLMDKYSLKREEDAVSFVVGSAGKSDVAVLRGKIFERLVHRMLPRGGKFQVRQLLPPKGKKANIAKPTMLELHRLQVSTLKNVSEISDRLKRRANDDLYLRPEAENFPAFDALRPPAEGYQVTINPAHTINLPGYEEIRPQMMTMDPFRVYIVTTPDRARKFKKTNALCQGA